MTSDFYQAPPIQDSRIFSSENIRVNILTTKNLHENVKCYELHKIMRQNDVHFINIFDRFQTASPTNEDIHFMNDFYLKPPSMYNTLLHLLYTNFKTNSHNNTAYNKKPNKTFNILQNIFILKHVHFISNYQCYHLTLMFSIIDWF
jgi:hypothetical protein